MPTFWRFFQALREFFFGRGTRISREDHGSQEHHSPRGNPNPPDEEGGGGDAADRAPVADSLTVETAWNRVDDPGTGSTTPFARVGGGRDDTRPPDLDSYVVIGLFGGKTGGSDRSAQCAPVVVKLELTIDCPDGKDSLEISRMDNFTKETIPGELVHSFETSGIASYYTSKSRVLENAFVSYIPEHDGNGGAIVVTHSKERSIANLGVQFFLRNV